MFLALVVSPVSPVSPVSLVSPVFLVSLVSPACLASLEFLVWCPALEVSVWAGTRQWGGAGRAGPLTLFLLSPQWVAQKPQQPRQRLQRKLQRMVSHRHPFPGREEGCLQMGRLGGTPGTVDGGAISGTPAYGPCLLSHILEPLCRSRARARRGCARRGCARCGCARRWCAWSWCPWCRRARSGARWGRRHTR